jgi:hypothetical protein
MGIPVGFPLTLMADASAASSAMRSFLDPVVATLCVIASLVSTFFLITGGIEYMSSRGKPENLEHAKRGLIQNFGCSGLIQNFGCSKLLLLGVRTSWL